MKQLTEQQYRELCGDAKVLTSDKYGDKVLERSDGLMIKLFRRKRRISSAALYPYALRFGNNSQRLRAKGFNTIQVQGIYDCPAIQRHVATYQKLDGVSLRECLAQTGSEKLLQQFAGYLAQMHAAGVYFRSVHLGNVLQLPDGNLGLIDVADMTIRPWRVGLIRRARNFAHLLKYKQDHALLIAHGETFLRAYLDASGLSGFSRWLLLRLLHRRHADLPAVTS